MSQSLQHISYRCGETEYSREMFASYPDRVLAVKFTADREKSLNFDLCITSQLRFETGEKGGRYFLCGICPTQSVSNTRELAYSDNDNEKGMTFSTACSVIARGEKRSAVKTASV